TATASGVVKNGDGSLFVDGPNGSVNSGVMVNAGTLGGTGSISGPVAIGSTATLAPGHNAPGILTTGADTLSNGSTFSVQLGGPTAGNGTGNYGQLGANGDVNLNGATLAASMTFTPSSTQTFTIIQTTGNVTGR